jgi:DtxR family Mn-dependent transcriptional regulator
MPSETVENYLKAIYTLCEESPSGEATMSRLAAALNVTTGTATAMVKKLNTSKLAKYHRYGGVTLTTKGTLAARDVLRRHRLVETFLVQALKLDWSEVHDEAERLEHAVSPRLLDAIDAFLAHPRVDPHGDPIPDRQGNLRPEPCQPLDTFSSGESVLIGRIANQDKAFLQFVATHGLTPGAKVKVLSFDPQAQSLQVQSEGRDSVSLSLIAAAKISAQHSATSTNRPRE